MNERLIEETIEYVKTLFEGNSGGHDADHTMRVYGNAMELAELEATKRQSAKCELRSGANAEECSGSEVGHMVDSELVALAALLHDADDYKLFKTEKNSNARRFLEEQGVPSERIDTICEVVNSVSFSKNQGRKPAALEAMIVQDADRLDAIGAVGIARTFAFGGEHGRDIANSVEHFHEKLLKLKGLMNTESAIKLAEERDSFMREFLAQLERETGIK